MSENTEGKKNILYGFVALTSIFTLFFAILLHFMVRVKTSSIDFARQEVKGIQYQVPLQHLFSEVLFHKLLSAKKKSPGRSKVKFPEFTNEISDSIDKVISVDSLIGKDLEFTPYGLSIRSRAEFTARALKEKWLVLNSAESSFGNKAVIQEHDALIKHIKIMITHLGDTSNLILDPDLDTYYLMDVSLLVIPQLQVHLSNVISLLLLRAQDQNLTASERSTFGNYATLLKESDLERLMESVNSSIREDQKFFGKSETLGVRLPPVAKELSEQIGRINSYMEDLSTGKVKKIDPDQAYFLLYEAINSTNTFWNIASGELRILLDNRISSQVSDCRKAISNVVLAWLILLVMVVLICRTVLKKQDTLAMKIQAQRITILSSSANLYAIGEMTGNIAHEVNTPISVIQLYSEQAIDVLGDATPDIVAVKKMLETIRDTASKIGQIILGVRKFSRDGSNDPMKPEKVTTLIEDSLLLCRDSIEGRKIKLIIQPIPKNLTIECRSIEISQLLLNLVKNAIDAIEKMPDPWIRISFQEFADEVEISVMDCGKGIQPEIQDKLFSTIFTTKPVGKGTGLGLGISKKIVESHGGSLWIDRYSPNTRFVIRLPIHQIEAPSSRKAG